MPQQPEAHIRPDADKLLSVINKSGEQKRGKLRIFFGMAAGVGKTFAMLRAAHRLKAEGTDVVVGFVETHGRNETAELTKGLETIPRILLPYQGIELEEFDLEAALQRQPHTIVVDELPHTNVPGSRHPKRYQDILELLDAGINVMTAFNVQHLESVADSVEAITNVHVQERVPDSFVDIASDIELVDLVPEELIRRLEEGKIYAPDKAAQAANNFFRKGNLTALREMALHFTASFVDNELQDYRTLKNIGDTWKTTERILVAVSPSANGENLIRLARQRAFELKARWIAVYIDVGASLKPEAQKSIAQNLALARELGAEVLSVRETDVVSGILRVARQKNITQVIVGKPPDTLWQRITGRSILDRLIRLSGNLEIHAAGVAIRSHSTADFLSLQNLTSSKRQYVVAMVATCLTTLFCMPLLEVIGYSAISLIYLTVVIILGLFLGRGPLVLAAAISALSWDFFFIPPQFTLHVGIIEDYLTLIIYFAVALAMGTLMARLRQRERVLMAREERVAAVYGFSRMLSRSTSLEQTVRNCIDFVGRFFDARLSLNLREKNGKLSLEPAPGSTRRMNAKEASVAFWAFENKKPAGRYTDTLPLAAATYYPLISTGGIVGVLGLRLSGKRRLTPDQEEILFAFVNHAAITIERDFLASEKRRMRVAEESEKLHAAILNSISHELRTPIAVILGAVSTMQLRSTAQKAAVQTELLDEVDIAARKLNVLVSNLLDMSRIEANKISLNRQYYDLRNVMSEVGERVKAETGAKNLQFTFYGEEFMCFCDNTLLQQALINIIANAVLHNQPAVNIDVQVTSMPEAFSILVSDNGKGISPDIIDSIFDKFVRSATANAGGTGLGLPIAKAIIELHGGTIEAENRPTGGACFKVRLPAIKVEVGK